MTSVGKPCRAVELQVYSAPAGVEWKLPPLPPVMSSPVNTNITVTNWFNNNWYFMFMAYPVLNSELKKKYIVITLHYNYNQTNSHCNRKGGHMGAR